MFVSGTEPSSAKHPTGGQEGDGHDAEVYSVDIYDKTNPREVHVRTITWADTSRKKDVHFIHCYYCDVV